MSKTITAQLEKLGLKKEDWAISEVGIQVLKSGIKKLLGKTRISSEVIKVDFQEGSHSTGGKKGDAVYMKGYASNEDGKQIGPEFYASATPENCSFPYRLEMCYNRLEAKIVLDRHKLSLYGADEMDNEEKSTRKKTPLDEAVSQLGKK